MAGMSPLGSESSGTVHISVDPDERRDVSTSETSGVSPVAVSVLNSQPTTSEQPLTNVQQHPLQKEVYKTKTQERRLVFNAVRNKSKQVELPSKKDQIADTQKDLKSMATLRGVVHQKMVREKVDPEIMGKVNGALKEETSFKGNASALVKLLKVNGLEEKTAKKIAKEIISEMAPSNWKPETHAKELAAHTDKIVQLLSKKDPTDKQLESINKEIIFTLRKAFQCPAYQALKECEDNPAIHYLHEVNLAMYTDVHLISAYTKGTLAKEIVKDASGNDRVFKEGHQMGDAVNDMRKSAVKDRGLFSSHSCLAYVKKHFKQFFGAFTSQKVGSVLGDYDPRGDLENNAGAMYKEKLSVKGKDASVLEIRTPSPTIGNKVTPEIRAALQAMENQRVFELKQKGQTEQTVLSKPEGVVGGAKLKVGGRPTCWFYTNLQEMTNEWNGEGDRSKAIMKLNQEFPLSFRGITLSKDSKYFKDGIGDGGSKMWEKVDTPDNKSLKREGVDEFVQELTEALSHDSHFTLQNRTESKNHGHGLYFPTEKQEMAPVLKAIAEESGELLKELIPEGGSLSGKDAWYAKAAVKEFAYDAIQRYFINKELVAREAEELPMNVVSSSDCKEHVDRGQAETVKKMWMHSAGDEKLLATIINMPALMGRYRVILEDRIQPLVGVMNLVGRQQAKEHRDALFPDMTSSSVEVLDKPKTQTT
jgi:hypothetical protein